MQREYMAKGVAKIFSAESINNQAEIRNGAFTAFKSKDDNARIAEGSLDYVRRALK